MAGHSLAGILELPTGSIQRFAVFAHCFTCTKDLKAIVHISRQLAHRGVAVLRFDFTGLGESGGIFRNTSFQDNMDDVRAAVSFLVRNYEPPRLLVGHSLGGAAVLAVAEAMDFVETVATIATPSTTQPLATTLSRLNPDIETAGQGEVEIGGRRYVITKQMIETLRRFDLPLAIRQLTKQLMIFSSPRDETISFDHAVNMLTWSGGPASLINLRDADHLLVNHPRHAPFIAHHLSP